jgi:epoxide hydrolase-like predicted phosphatase
VFQKELDMGNNKVRAVIFDMGGVLVRTVDPTRRTNLAKKYGMTYQEIDTLVFGSETARLATVGQIPEEDHWDSIAEQLKLSKPELNQFQADFWTGDELNHELVSFIKEIHSSRKTGLLSNAWSGARASLASKFSFLHLFDVSVFSAELGMAKPDPRFYDWILNKLGVQAAESIFVDDFLVNIEAAQALGFMTIHFKDNKQTLLELKTLITMK